MSTPDGYVDTWWLSRRPKGCACASLRQAQGCYERCDDAVLFREDRRPGDPTRARAGLLILAGVALVAFVLSGLFTLVAIVLHYEHILRSANQ